jgi:hypothetical protein
MAFCKENDVILKIDEFDIADDGTIQLTEDLLTDYKHAIDMHHIGESIDIIYSRGGVEKTVDMKAEIPMANYSLVRGEQFDKVPRILHLWRCAVCAAQHEPDQALGQRLGQICTGESIAGAQRVGFSRPSGTGCSTTGACR